MANNQLENVSFDFIRYSNCWEDPRLLIDALEGQSERYLSIASAGDNSFSLLTLNPELVVALDISKVQLFLSELKKVAISHLDRQAYLEFVGFLPSTDREHTFEQIKKDLSTACRSYWDGRPETIREGVIVDGKFEKFFLKFRHEVLPEIHDQATVQELLRPKSAEEQRQFYEDVWDTKAWRDMFPKVFNKKIFGEEGRDPEFMKYVETDVPTHIYQCARNHYSSVNAFDNPFLRFFLTGNFEDALPHYVREENYDQVRSNIDRIEFHEGLLESAFEHYSNFSRFNLSNIFEYMDVPLFREVSKQIIENSSQGAVYAYWNLMIDRRISAEFPDRVEYLADQSEKLTEIDHGYFYKCFIADRKK